MTSSFFTLLVVMAFLPFGSSQVTDGKPEPCPVTYSPIGCFKDKRNERTMPELLMTDRDPSSHVSSGYKILWKNFPIYLQSLACRCAMKAKEHGYTTFGLQYYGECHSGENAGFTFDQLGESTDCVNGKYADCENTEKACVGKGNANFVYIVAAQLVADTDPGSGSGSPGSAGL